MDTNIAHFPVLHPSMWSVDIFQLHTLAFPVLTSINMTHHYVPISQTTFVAALKQEQLSSGNKVYLDNNESGIFHMGGNRL